MWVDKEQAILRTVLKRMKEKDLTILDAYNEVLDFPSKDDTITTQLHLYPSARKMKKIFNKIGSPIPQIFITPPEAGF